MSHFWVTFFESYLIWVSEVTEFDFVSSFYIRPSKRSPKKGWDEILVLYINSSGHWTQLASNCGIWLITCHQRWSQARNRFQPFQEPIAWVQSRKIFNNRCQPLLVALRELDWEHYLKIKFKELRNLRTDSHLDFHFSAPTHFEVPLGTIDPHCGWVKQFYIQCKFNPI